MITSIEIKNFRGIRTGLLEGLAPLTILTGPNGCGKSSVLDALLIGSSWIPEVHIAQAILRHARAIDGGRWLFLDRFQPAQLRVGKAAPKPESIERRLSWVEHPGPEPEFEKLAMRQAPGPYRQVACLSEDGSRLAQVFLAIDNFAIPRQETAPRSAAAVVRLIDPSIPSPLEDSYSEVYRLGLHEEALDLLLDLVDELQAINILTEANREPRLYLTKKGGAVPVSLSGDGIQALLQMVLELSLVPQEGLALIEEPEAFLHPRAIFQCAKALVKATREGRQIVLTTHSLELIDAILGYIERDTKYLAILNLRLIGKELKSVVSTGDEARFARNEIEDDLR